MIPNYDPSWSGPGSLILATLEVDIASICASVPIFWPVFSSRFLEVFVVSEVTVERSDARDSEMISMGPVVSQEALIHKKGQGLKSAFSPSDYGSHDVPFTGHVDPRGDMFGAAVYIKAEDHVTRRT